MLHLETAEARCNAARIVTIDRRSVHGQTAELRRDIENDSYEIRFDAATAIPCEDMQDAVARFNALGDPAVEQLDPAYRRLGDMRKRPEHTMRVVAVGATPEAAIESFCGMLNHETPVEIEPMHDDDPASGTWSRIFKLAGEGTGMKAAGRYVPGGVVMTWWK